MEAIRLQKTIERDGEISLGGLPFKKGQNVEMIILADTTPILKRLRLTARQLLDSGLIGLWQDRTDIVDSAVYARQLREQAQRRQR
jgi:hypothetical protein